MISTQHRWIEGQGWQGDPLPDPAGANTLLFVFGDRFKLADDEPVRALRELYPQGQIVGCSTAGDIVDQAVVDDSVNATAVHFEHTTLHVATEQLASRGDSEAAGRKLGTDLASRPGLRHVLVLTEGLEINGCALLDGLQQELPEDVLITGGMAGDGDRNERTLVLSNGPAHSLQIVAVGLYGDRLTTTGVSMGGWGPFGPDRMITRARANVLYEFDGEPALELYKRYLGDYAETLPMGALHFPLSVQAKEGEIGVVRTVVNVDETEGSLILTGDVPEGHYARLMKTNVEKLIDGAEGAAVRSVSQFTDHEPDLALLISCFGRRFVMRQRVEEELEAVRAVYGSRTRLFGFYSYGEYCPHHDDQLCHLHNQTMTITTFSEA